MGKLPLTRTALNEHSPDQERAFFALCVGDSLQIDKEGWGFAMDVGLGWLGVGFGCVGFIALYALASASVPRQEHPDAGAGRRSAWLAAGVTLLVTLVFWAVSMRTRQPFSPGQTLGWGFAIGGLTGAAALLLSLRFGLIESDAGSVRPRYLTSSSTAFFALFSASLPYLIFHGYPGPAMVGFAIGAAMAAILGCCTVAPVSRSTVQTWAAFAISIAASVVIAVAHFDQPGMRVWWSLPILMATTVCAAGFVGSELGSVRKLDSRPGPSFALSSLISAVLVAGLAAIYSVRLVNSWQLFWVTLIGILISLVISWLAAGLASGRGSGSLVDAGAGAVLLVIGFIVVAFKLWSGLGIGLGLVAAWGVVIPSLGVAGARQSSAGGRTAELGPIPSALTGALFLGLSVLLFRLFVEQYRGDLGTTDIRIHYAFVGALLGAIAPSVLVSLFAAPNRAADDAAGSRWTLLGAAGVGLFAAAVPLVLFVVWEFKAVMGFVFGLVAAAALLLVHAPAAGASGACSRDEDEATPGVGGSGLQSRYEPAIVIVAAQLVAIQFVGPLAGIEMTRSARVWVLVCAGAVGLIWAIVSGILAARRSR